MGRRPSVADWGGGMSVCCTAEHRNLEISNPRDQSGVISGLWREGFMEKK